MQLLQIPSIQETLEHFTIYSLDVSKCNSVFELLVEFKRVKYIRIEWGSEDDDKDEDKLVEWKLKVKKFYQTMNKKHSRTDIDIRYKYIHC